MGKSASKVSNLAPPRLSGRISSSRYLSDFLSQISTMARQNLGSDRCSLLLVDSLTNTLVLKAMVGLPSRYRTVSPIPCETSTEGRAITVRKPILITDLYKDPDCTYKETAKVLALGTMVCIPLKAGAEILGVVNIYTAASPDTFSTEIEPITNLVYKAAAKINDMALLGGFFSRQR